MFSPVLCSASATVSQGAVGRPVTHPAVDCVSVWQICLIKVSFKKKRERNKQRKEKKERERDKQQLQETQSKPGMVSHTCNPSTQEAEAGGSL